MLSNPFAVLALVALVHTAEPIPPQPADLQPADPGLAASFRAAALVGATSITSDAPHFFAGGELGYLFWRSGVVAQGFLGTSDRFDSTLFSVGPVFRVYDAGRRDVYLTAGLGGYSESIPEGFDRSTLVVTGGLSGRIPAGPVRVAVTLMGWMGRLDDDDFAESVSRRGVRLAFGVGL